MNEIILINSEYHPMAQTCFSLRKQRSVCILASNPQIQYLCTLKNQKPCSSKNSDPVFPI